MILWLLFHAFSTVLFLKVSEAGVHRPHVGGIHGRSNDGSYSLVLAGGFEDEVVSDLSVSFIFSVIVSGEYKTLHSLIYNRKAFQVTIFIKQSARLI